MGALLGLTRIAHGGFVGFIGRGAFENRALPRGAAHVEVHVNGPAPPRVASPAGHRKTAAYAVHIADQLFVGVGLRH